MEFNNKDLGTADVVFRSTYGPDVHCQQKFSVGPIPLLQSRAESRLELAPNTHDEDA